jgi:putative ABC transport system permease protein
MLLRDIQDSKGQFISILIIITLGITFYTGLNSTLRNLSFASQEYYTDYRLAHIWAYFSKTPENVLERIRRVPGVAKVTGRVVRDVKLNPVENNVMLRLITLPNARQEVINDVLLRSGRYFTQESGNQCLVEEAFFKAKGLRIGDYLRPVINGTEFKLKIIGTVKSPEYIYQLRDGNELVPNLSKFGIVYVKESYARLLFDFNGSINEACILLSDQSAIGKIQDQLDRILEKHGLREITPRQEQLSYNAFSGEIEQLNSFGSVFPMMFLIVAALITYITMSRIVENQRSLIGTLKALGYSNFHIIAYYLSFAVVFGIAGSILGSIFGQYFSELLLSLYNSIYQLPLGNSKPQYDLVIPASLMALGFGLLAGYNAVKVELRLVPAESMRPKAPKAGKKTLFEQIRILWRKLNFSWKIIIRNLFRYKKRIIFTAVGIIMATALLLTALGMSDSIKYMITKQFTQIQQYDLKVNLEQLFNVNELSYLKSIAHVVKMEPMVEMGVEFRNGWRTKKMGLVVLNPGSELYRLADGNGKRIHLTEGGMLLSERASEILGLQDGDVAQYRILWPGKRSKEDQKNILVQGKISQYVGQSAYGSIKQVNRFLGEGRIANVVLLKLDDQRNETEVVKKLSELSMVSSVQSKAESIFSLKQALESVGSMVGIFILAAGALAFAVIYNITNINIHERQRELATLKVLGFTESEIKQLIFNENFIVTFLGVLAGLPVGGVFLEALMTSGSTDNMTMPAILFDVSYLWTFCLMFGFTILANLVLTRKIRSINMVEALKSSE